MICLTMSINVLLIKLILWKEVASGPAFDTTQFDIIRPHTGRSSTYLVDYFAMRTCCSTVYHVMIKMENKMIAVIVEWLPRAVKSWTLVLIVTCEKVIWNEITGNNSNKQGIMWRQMYSRYSCLTKWNNVSRFSCLCALNWHSMNTRKTAAS